MAFRFQKRIKVAPGIRLNLSKSGVSASAGVSGATVNIGAKGVRGTAGIPGTGLSWSKQSGWADARDVKPADELPQLNQLLERLAESFNALSPKINKVTESWNKAIESFESGRGPSAAKFQTLQKKFEKAAEGYRKISDDAEEHRATVEAIIERVSAMKFGLFSGKKRDAQKYLISIADEHRSAAEEIIEALASVTNSVEGEIAAAKNSF